MALVVAGSVSALVSSNSLTLRARSSSSSSGWSRIQVGGPRRGSIIGARLAVERSAFLGDSWADENSSLGEFGFDRYGHADGERRSSRAQCVGGFQGRGGGRVFFVPFGPKGRGGRETVGRREWAKMQREQQEGFRQMLEQEIKSRSGAANSSDGFALLREIEMRLRAEEKGHEKYSDAFGKNGQQRSAQAEKEGTAASSGPSTYELMKELEKRLRAEREDQRERQRVSPKSSGESTECEGRVLRMGAYSSLSNYMREWDREMREQRATLEEQWKLREESRVNANKERKEEETKLREESRVNASKERKEEETFKDQKRRRWQEDFGPRAAPASERREEVEDPASVGSPEFAQGNETVVYLKNEANGAEIYLVGTSHVSPKSVDEVREVIERVKPDFVMVELCRKRYENMGRNASQKDQPMAFVEQMARMLTNGNVGAVGKLVGVGLSSFYRILSYRGFHPGREFQVAIEEGKKIGAKIVLGDQDIDTTMQQLGKFNLNISVQDAFNFFGKRMPEDIAQSIGGKSTSDEDMFERMRNRKIVRRFNEEMEKGAPTIYKALLVERNEIMVKALRNLKGKVVAVVGLAHMDGMEQLWQQANEKYLAGQSD